MTWDVPLVLLHPLGVDGRVWEPLLGELGTGPLDVLTPDLLGHGAAPLPPVGASIMTFADAVIETLTAGPVDLVGVSLGGLVAQHIAGHRPELVRRLVLADTVAVYGESMRQSWRDRAATARTDGLGILADPMAAMWFTDGFREQCPDRVAAVRTAFLATDPEGYARTCEALETADTTDVVKAVEAPTLVVCGDQDAPPFVEAARWLSDHIEDASLCWLDGKHAVVLEQPSDFVRALRDFLG